MSLERIQARRGRIVGMRYSLRTLFVLTTLVALWAWLATIIPVLALAVALAIGIAVTSVGLPALLETWGTRQR